MSRFFSLILVVFVILGWPCLSQAQTLLQTGFETSEGYPGKDQKVDGTSLGDAEWAKHPKLSSVQIADYFQKSGKQAARAWGTACALFTFNTKPAIACDIVRMESCMVIEDVASQKGYVEMALLVPKFDSDIRQASVLLDETSGKLAFRSGRDRIVSDHFTFEFKQFYRVALELNFISMTARVYARQVAQSDKSGLTDADLVTFNDGKTSIDFDPSGCIYAGRLQLLATAGTQGFFDDLQVTAIQAP